MLIKEEYKIYKITHSNWKTPTIYEISNYGNCKKNGIEYIPNKNVVGYLSCGSFLIHRMVAETFIHNPNNYKEVDHIDGNTHNNRVDNLRWVTHQENLNNDISRKRNSEAKIKQYKDTDLQERLSKIHKQKFIDNPELKEKYRHSGWHHSEETKLKIKERTSGKNNPMYGKSIFDFMTEEKIKSWKEKLIGRKAWNKGKDCSIYKHDYTKCRIWINNKVINKLINPNDLQKYISDGYTLGRKKKE